ncbi:MAG: hypothetical protein COU10_03765 [Candidatus Harrisonbacteria bacterium CG10_big_fil_rev_8_21_14_0_10_45_28]|uniref:Uncharacterized protein n=1 Tax=Candidatus Harrisonbacteria bacterium CG10_big_fil_rev_8_21_14_0_10_45_28 TaxID=1974586 RepID=A0A2H0UME2_9BACT|nr:MAG: hypothetical protein COU10_03765 [Candidatus Harrisonbacteria bacterium CG10_big_fil_rev_8_21_14_0_10_45_28]
MKITVEARPGQKVASVEKVGEGRYRVKIDAPAKENKANLRLLEILAEYFDVPFSCVRFVSGAKSKIKILEIDGRG